MAIKGRPRLPSSCTRWKAAQSWVLSLGLSAQTGGESRSLLRSSPIAAKTEDEESRLLFWTCSPIPGRFSILQQPLGSSSSAEPLTRCWNKKFPRAGAAFF